MAKILIQDDGDPTRSVVITNRALPGDDPWPVGECTRCDETFEHRGRLEDVMEAAETHVDGEPCT